MKICTVVHRQDAIYDEYIGKLIVQNTSETLFY